MTKKAKSAKKQGNLPRKPQPNLLRASQMLGFARQPKKGKALFQALQTLDMELEAAYQTVRALPNGDPNEDEALQMVRDMENRRFELLSEIHGNQVQGYKWITA